jgi:hypothetical protein
MTTPNPWSLGTQDQIQATIKERVYLQFAFDAFGGIPRFFNSGIPLPSESSANQNQRKQWQHEFGAKLNVESGLGQTGRQLGTGVTPTMTRSHIVIAPKYPVCRHGEQEQPSGAQLLAERPQGLQIIVEMLQDIEQADQIEFRPKTALEQISPDKLSRKAVTRHRKSFLEQISAGNSRVRKKTLQFRQNETRAAAMLEDIMD